ncbi:hypothetical protein EIN_429130 [Entamoeba invadens IP1]|uniref:RING-type domain-containing protein n=1 Tax=Entamoeba invadens IP1 TaxID=370355 RepID=A0A0A1UHE2_ENTIV|nr:hypothetical protein EIN_429130 [Entamoeba invadens IP1]ELP95167.1 hypothetical protein EIN_429130 [Entamoeba invadens IP1]|eukprot:XP_004261938.1 hypothetical protein EIN_429130 [Entamoeba invadens IP1]
MRRGRVQLEPQHYIYSHFQFSVFPNTDFSQAIRGRRVLYCDDAVTLTLPTTKKPICPICLDEVILPRLTACGHLYCWKCLLQFFVLCPAPHKCPVCNAIISPPFTICDIKILPILNVGDSITMKLLKIPKELVTPTIEGEKMVMSPPTSKDKNKQFYHIVVEEDPLAVLARERVRVNMESQKPQDEPCQLYFNMMCEELDTIKRDWQKRLTKVPEEKIELSGWKLYYQDTLGRNIFLLPFNQYMLLETFPIPKEITSTVLEIEEECVGFPAPGKFQNKMFQHFPIGTEVQVIEIDMKKLVTNSIYSKNLSVIRRRENKRQKIVDDEKQREEEERLKEEARIADLKEMNKHYIFKPDDYEERKDEIILEYFPSLPCHLENKENVEEKNVKKVVKKKKQKKNGWEKSEFPPLGALPQKGEKVEKKDKIVEPPKIEMEKVVKIENTKMQKTEKVEKKVQKSQPKIAKKTSRKNKKKVDLELLGTYLEVPPVVTNND